MNIPKRTFLIAITTALFVCASDAGVEAAIPPAPPSMSHYQQVWEQDFSTMTKLSQLGVSDSNMGTGTWIAHKPGGGDWFTFANPTGDFHPFGVGNGYLTIRVQKDGHDPNNWFSGYSGGLLSSLDGAGKGFAQQYGYFECSMWVPGGPNTWPAFWLLDAPAVTNNKLSAAEIDITESYGNWGTGPEQKPPGDPLEDSVTWHRWTNPATANGSFTKEPDMTTGFHTYGCDVEPTGITWYYDRRKIWWAPIYPEAQRPLYVLVNLALGGGNHNNAKGDNYDWNLTPNPSDLKVKYVAVWASPASPNYTGQPVAPADLKAIRGSKTVALSWTTALGAASYTVYRGTKAIATGLTTTNYTDRDLTNGTAYAYKVVTVNAKGSSDPSTPVSATPKFGPPIDPSDLQAAVGEKQIALAWTASPDAASYNIYRGTGAGAESAQPVATGVPTAEYTDKGLTDGTPFFYTIAAVSPGGTSSHSNEVNGVPALEAETVAVAYAATALAGDGMDDAAWKGATAYPINRLGLGTPTTTNGVFKLMWDPTNLYYLFTINDSALVNGTPDYNGDAVEMYVDALNTKMTKYDATDYRYTLGYGHTTISEPLPAAIANVTFARKDYPGGYRERVTIPWATLGMKPFVGMSLGLDIAIDDASTSARGRTSALFWNDRTANDYQNPSLFGNGTLQPKLPRPPITNGVYKILNVTSGKVLDVPGASMANVALDQTTYTGGANQQWKVTDLGGGSYSVANVKSGSVADCAPTFDNLHPVVQWPVNGTPSATQRFTITAIGGHYLLTNVFSGKALDVAGSSTDDKAAIVQAVVTASGSQLWDLVPVGNR
ncbi:MAG: RICIN domain-containing protein [Armatimonadota bacterium]|nr:RICIN domain-containing protein [Armatimonadota bacterium]